jgi:hypothetical protein
VLILKCNVDPIGKETALKVLGRSVSKIYKIRKHPNMLNDFLAQELRIDHPKTETDLVREAQEALPYMPISFWEANKDKPLYYKNASCARFPDIYKLKINNVYWQIFSTHERTFYLFGAYYDVRREPCVRLLGMTNTFNLRVKSYCQMWFADAEETVIVETGEYSLILYPYWGERKEYHHDFAYLITCPVPAEYSKRVPILVSLVEEKCDIATNSFRVVFNKPNKATEKKGRIAVCVKMTDFYHSDESARIVEWIELLGILGAEKIYFSTLHVHKNLTKVFEYYEKKGIVEVTPYTLPVARINEPASFQRLALHQDMYQYNLIELISLHDCFYRNVYQYEYITAIDTDEVIVPKKVYTWVDLLRKATKKASTKNMTPACYIAQNVHFNSVCQDRPKTYKEIPPYMHILQNVVSHTLGAAPNPKLFFNTDLVEVFHNHVALKCFAGKCVRYKFNVNDAILQHYRHRDHAGRECSCDQVKRNMRNDTTIWKYKEPLINRTLAALYDLGFFDEGQGR